MIYSFTELKRKIFLENNRSLISEIGKKAFSLLELIRFGAEVPDGFCIPANILNSFLIEHRINLLVNEAAENYENKDKLNDLLASIRQRILSANFSESFQVILKQLFHDDSLLYAVRSSGSKEDLQNASFAGQYETVLNAKGCEAIANAIKTCWASMFSSRVIQYSCKKGLKPTDLGMSVIIQKMVQAEKSGVVFTVNPVTGVDTQMLIESVFGLGDSLVSGEKDPDQYVFDWYHEKLIDKKLTTRSAKTEEAEVTLNEHELNNIVDIALNIQTNYGFPVDIEWAFSKGRFYILQARPITSINFSGIHGQWSTADLKDGGISSAVCSQLMYSLYKMVWDKLMPEYLIKTKLIDENKGVRSDFFYGRMYWAAGAVKEGLKRIIGFNEREFDESLGIEVGYEGDGHVTGLSFASVVTGIKVMIALEKSFKHRLLYNEKNGKKIAARIEEIDRLAIDTLDEKTFFDHFNSLIFRDYYLVEGAYFKHIFDNANVQTTFRDVVKKYPGINFLNLVIGLKNLSHLKPIEHLWQITRKIRKDPLSFDFWLNRSVDEIKQQFSSGIKNFNLDQLNDYLKKFKYLSTRELDITVANYGEDPSFVVETIKQQIQLDDDCNPTRLNDNQHCRFLEEKDRLLSAAGFFNRKSVEAKLERMRRFLWWREELRDLSTRMYDQIRRFCLQAGTFLEKRGIFTCPQDVFFLRVYDLFAIIEGKTSPEKAKQLIRKNRQYYQSFRNFKNPDDIGFKMADQPTQSFEDHDYISGIACSSGVVSGRVKLIKDIADTIRIEKGDILITRFTDPAWTPLFSLISAVVTETGGVLSHAAVISREYGIPAVLAVKGIFEKFKDGDEIVVDGNNGRIYFNRMTELKKGEPDEITITAFSPEDSTFLQEFVDFPKTIYLEDNHYIAPFDQTIMDEFNPQKNPFFSYGKVSCFIAERNQSKIARCAAFFNPKMNHDGKKYGAIGFFECVDDYQAAQAILERACSWLKEKGCDRIVGPMNFSIWSRYRFRLDNFDQMPFYTENYNKSWYPDFFLKYGFHEVRRWSSRKMDLQDSKVRSSIEQRLAKYEKRYQKALSMGYSFEFNNRENFDKLMIEIHQVVNDSFSGHYLFYPISQEEFLFIFSGLKSLIKEKQIIVARKNGKVQGFMIHCFDYGKAIAAMGGNTSAIAKLRFWFKRSEETLLALFIAVNSQGRKDLSGVSAAIAYLTGKEILANQKIRYIVHCTMYEGNLSNVMSAGVGKTIGTYALFEKNI